MDTYTVIATPSEDPWSMQCVELPASISEVFLLANAIEAIREAIAQVAQIPGDAFDINFLLDPEHNIVPDPARPSA